MPIRTRREEYSDASYRALVESARHQFASQGFAATSLDDIASDARLTKGAVYHHFANKQALFQTVMTELQRETVTVITEATRQVAAQGGSAWAAALGGLDAFLARCLDPVYQRICFLEGPLALGFTCWWETAEANELGLIRHLVADLHAQLLIEIDDIDTLTHLLFGSLIAAALDIARSPEPAQTRDRVREVVARMISGLRPLPAPPDPSRAIVDRAERRAVASP